MIRMRLHSSGNFDVIIKDGDDFAEFTKRWKKKHYKQNKLIEERHIAKHRKLGFIPLNERFENSEAHHIDFELVVYIPEQLHHSIYHNIWTGRGMTEMNNKVFEWLEQLIN
jgi:hypothetical protein